MSELEEVSDDELEELLRDPTVKTQRIRFIKDTPVDFETVPRGLVGIIAHRPYKGVDTKLHGKMEKYIPAGREMVVNDYVGGGFAEVIE